MLIGARRGGNRSQSSTPWAFAPHFAAGGEGDAASGGDQEIGVLGVGSNDELKELVNELAGQVEKVLEKMRDMKLEMQSQETLHNDEIAKINQGITEMKEKFNSNLKENNKKLKENILQEVESRIQSTGSGNGDAFKQTIDDMAKTVKELADEVKANQKKTDASHIAFTDQLIRLKDEHATIHKELSDMKANMQKSVTDMEKMITENINNRIHEHQQEILQEVDSRIESKIEADVPEIIDNRLKEINNEVEIFLKEVETKYEYILKNRSEFEKEVFDQVSQIYEKLKEKNGDVKREHRSAPAPDEEIEEASDVEDDSHPMNELESELKPRLLALQQGLSTVASALRDFQSGRVR